MHIDNEITPFTEVQIRQGATIERLKINPSSKETTGFDCAYVKNITLSDNEYSALGVVSIAGVRPKVDVILLDYPSDNPYEENNELWLSMITDNNPELAEGIYKNIRSALIPNLESKELTEIGLSKNGSTSRNVIDSPYNSFLNAILKTTTTNKNILVILGHGDTIDTGTRRIIGSYSDHRATDYPSHLLNNLKLANYSVVLDATCSYPNYYPETNDINISETPIFMAQNPVVLKGRSNEEQSASFKLENGVLTDYNWRNILINRRQSGRLK